MLNANRIDKRIARRDCPALTLCALLRADLALERAREVIRAAKQYAGTRSSPIPISAGYCEAKMPPEDSP